MFEDESSPPGAITREHTIWCGGCPKWEQEAIPKMKEVVAHFRSAGWVKTKKHGWLCPVCKKDPPK